jgi:membrane protease YdiL (CAAX protease family)
MRGLEFLILGTAAMATMLVFVDARTRLPRSAAFLWMLLAFATGGLAAPVYLLARPSRAPAWGLSEVAALPIFFVLALAPVLLLFESFVLRPDLLSSIGVIVVLTVLQNAVFVGASLYVALVKYRLPLASIGLAGGTWRRWLSVAAFASGLALVGNFIGQNLTVFVAGLVIGQRAALDLVTRHELRSPVYRMLQAFHHPRDVVILALLIGVVVPIGEEVFFRGLTYGALRRRLNRHVAVFASALFFAVAHLESVEVLPILILGMILAYLYDYTGSLIPGMVAHAVNNLAALVLFYLS